MRKVRISAPGEDDRSRSGRAGSSSSDLPFALVSTGAFARLCGDGMGSKAAWIRRLFLGSFCSERLSPGPGFYLGRLGEVKRRPACRSASAADTFLTQL